MTEVTVLPGIGIIAVLVLAAVIGLLVFAFHRDHSD